MTTFFIDLWHDLRERRLWPVAVGLLAAIVAVPVILFKPASDAAPPTAAAPKPTGVATLPVVNVESGPVQGSKLEAFRESEKNPFKPMKDLAENPSDSAGTKGPGGDTPAAATATGPGSTGSDAGSTGGTSGGSVSGGSPSGGTTTPGGTTTRTTQWFRYAADFSFGRTGDKAKKFERAANFTLLPSETKPTVVFLGVGSDGKTAMFFVADAGFTAGGEGACNAEGAACRYVTLKLGESSDEETFSAVDGSASYDLKLLDINREELGSGDAPALPEEPKNGKTLADTGAGVYSATRTTQDVLPAMFADGPGVAVESK